MITLFQYTNEDLRLQPAQFDNDTSTVPHQVYIIITKFSSVKNSFRAFLLLLFPYKALVLNHPSVFLPFFFHCVFLWPFCVICFLSVFWIIFCRGFSNLYQIYQYFSVTIHNLLIILLKLTFQLMIYNTIKLLSIWH